MSKECIYFFNPALVIYFDYALTIIPEIEYIWRGGLFKASTFLYFFARYALVANLLYLLAISNVFGNRVRASAVQDPF